MMGHPASRRSHPGACSEFEEALHLRMDRELGPAEEAHLDAHLQGCAGCQAQTRRLESLSSTLKAWDAQQGAALNARARVRHAVLARVEDEAGVRQGRLRLRRWLRVAQAAAVILTLGAAAVLGASLRPDPAARNVPVATRILPGSARMLADASERAPLPAPDEVRLPALDLGLSGPVPAAALPVWVDGACEEPQRESQGGHALIARLERERLRRERFERLTDGPAIAVVLPGRSAMLSPLHMTPEGAQYLEARDAGGQSLRERIELWWSQAQSRPSTTDPVSAGEEALSDVRPADLLPLGVLRAPAFADRAPVRQWSAQRPGESVLDVRALSAEELGQAAGAWGGLRSGRPPSESLDPLLAQRDGSLRMVASGQDDGSVVAIVRGTTQPIYLPAGQLLVGGGVDRMLARGAWLPPATGEETPHLLACVAVAHDPARPTQDGAVQLTPWIAGPSLRGLLAVGASEAQVTDFAFLLVQELVGGGLARWDRWSLRMLFDRPGADRLREVHAGLLDWDRARGFVVTAGSAGGFVGVEAVDLGGQAGRELLLRLYLGYTLEAALRGPLTGAREMRTDRRPQRLSGSGAQPLPAVLEALASAEQRLHERREDGSASQLHGRVAGVDVAMSALRSGERVRAVSALHFIPLD